MLMMTRYRPGSSTGEPGRRPVAGSRLRVTVARASVLVMVSNSCMPLRARNCDRTHLLDVVAHLATTTHRRMPPRSIMR